MAAETNYKLVSKAVNKLGYELIKHDYQNKYSKILIKHKQCATVFETTYHKLTHNGACPTCKIGARPNIEEAKTLAAAKQGTVLGFAEKHSYNSTWKCKEGHEWKAKWSSVKRGSWCPYCAGKKAISKLHTVAVAKLYQHKRWDSSKGFICKLTVEDIVLALQSKCVYCDRQATNVDRKNSNLGHFKENCVPCCGRCNMVKSNRVSYETMLEIGKVLKKLEP
jgi:hypothetical protein